MHQRPFSRLLVTFILLLTSATTLADGPKDNDSNHVRRIPRPGISVTPSDRRELEAGLQELDKLIKQIKDRHDARSKELLPDVEIFHRAVRTALDHDEFFSAGDIGKAKRLLNAGTTRGRQLLSGEAPWTRQTGLVVRGYRSKIDHTVQPYGLVIPDSHTPTSSPVRLDIWFHGRGETLSEVNFIDQRSRHPGQYTPANTIVLHPYGRYSNAFKFAGETDVLEALADVRQRYSIDPDRISVRGFSMGGAACWQFAVHYSDRWFAANPGAGFSETPEFLKSFQRETLTPTWYERRLWHWYDCPDYASNLWQCPTIAYSGELDIQKQAADVMERALARRGIELVHVIGPQTKHAIHAQSKQEIERRMAALARIGRCRVPRRIEFETYTLKYNRMNWIRVHALRQHWHESRVTAAIELPTSSSLGRVTLQVSNIDELSVDFGPGEFPGGPHAISHVLVYDQESSRNADGELVTIMRPTQIPAPQLPKPQSDRSWSFRLHRVGTSWHVGPLPAKAGTLRKRHNLQGPIDDAFMDSFIFVRPTGKSAHTKIGQWVGRELEHAITHWRRQFRGDARVKNDADITEEDITSANLILFGDPASNSILARIEKELPIRWTGETISAGRQRFAADHHVPVLIYPNPLNPKRYVVLNSGFTYREYDYLNNARQVPKLPDWAVIDVNTPADSRRPGRIAAADFFDERWHLKPPHAKQESLRVGRRETE